MFIWEEKYSIHIAMIDEQHKTLFKIANTIYNELQKDSHSFDTIIALILEMIDYTKYHFNTEEEMMVKYQYPDLEDHKNQHNRFVDYIDSLSFIDIDENQDHLLRDMVDFLSNWILNHISKTDLKFGNFINEKNESA